MKIPSREVYKRRRIREIGSTLARRRAGIATNVSKNKDGWIGRCHIEIDNVVPRSALATHHSAVFSARRVGHHRAVGHVCLGRINAATVALCPIAHHDRIDQSPATHVDPTRFCS